MINNNTKDKNKSLRLAAENSTTRKNLNGLVIKPGGRTALYSRRGVLVCVLKNKRDLDVLMAEKWYRIPAAYMPGHKFKYLAFYQPVSFGRRGKRILYYAEVLNCRIAKRKNLLPKEARHPRAENFYLKIRIGKIKKLPEQIRNVMPRRISFGFTTLEHLLKSKNILELYNIAETEKIMEKGLRMARIKSVSQYNVKCGNKRFRLDFAVFCKKGAIAVECDNKKAHSGKARVKKDKIKNALLKQCGWTIMRFSESKIVSDLDGCILQVKKAVGKLGGFTP
ncbi:MAG: hypothetical protein A3G49_06205 [Candidatus Sungbacteria bacterium RIFCSPLOWO2_12_FULL_41_11]|uniref:Restriction endonuclease type II-like domain-containing protein n=1 Tax=Candidatus Sungbacteria bacterium RIFCSPLOWO2_12_FULL_41_11 TaxID=1802286 RepID=A0A1G2LQY4_9BACT|nr:MAG: hypothetical protein UV01_C0004G0107 [Parcubacteria group bacterium GW2011_GWA2_42_14]OHA14026.1 MAG: hypothetical protein A3G49_06205 [Candidatus Sungbacteria bacterium RIFCSPLOWO2_12_FULL_41_11]